jgi:hypothetical protein
MRRIHSLLLAALLTIALAAPLQAGIFCKHKHKAGKDGIDCGPVDWRWRLPPGNGLYWAPNPCIGPAATYSAPIPPHYRGPYLRTIDVPLE